MGNAEPDIEVGKTKRPSRARWYVLLGLLLPFTALSYLAVSSGSHSDVRDRPVALTTLATITGPFVGAIARNGQTCCLGFSLRLAVACGPVLALGLISQLVPLPFRRGQRAVRLGLWTLGWLVWLSGGPVSFLHAFG
ncbi:MAG TPA: hypothetical protein VF590_08525 [Isosphaeraceae bacterium]|jgi:hypothetical protein